MRNNQLMQSPEELTDSLAEAFAEGFVYLAGHDLLREFEGSVSTEPGSDTP